jgi:putative transposase
MRRGRYRRRGGLPGAQRVPFRVLRLERSATVGPGRRERAVDETHREDPRRFPQNVRVPRVHAELVLGLGWQVNHKRVARLMRQAGVQGLYRRRTRRSGTAGPVTEDDLVHRRFAVEAPDRLWFTAITEHPTNEGKLYCAAVMDAYSRMIIGWSIADHVRTQGVTDALGMALVRRSPTKDETILHGDHGAQYTSWAFGQRLRSANLSGFHGNRRRLL